MKNLTVYFKNYRGQWQKDTFTTTCPVKAQKRLKKLQKEVALNGQAEIFKS